MKTQDIINKIDPIKYMCDSCRNSFTNDENDCIVSEGMNLCSICGKYFLESLYDLETILAQRTMQMGEA